MRCSWASSAAAWAVEVRNTRSAGPSTASHSTAASTTTTVRVSRRLSRGASCVQRACQAASGFWLG